jgi:hypothetical protein
MQRYYFFHTIQEMYLYYAVQYVRTITLYAAYVEYTVHCIELGFCYAAYNSPKFNGFINCTF